MSFSSKFLTHNMRLIPQTFSVYLIIILASVLAVINPVIVGAYLNFEVMPTIYLLIFDFAIAVIGVLCFLHFKSGRKLFLVASLFGIFCLPILMGSVELMLTYIRITYGEKWNEVLIRNVHKPDSVLGWRPRPNDKGYHRVPGNFSVIYEFDEKGRKTIPQIANITQTLHFFGDSYIFGFGVSNEDTALNILATRMRNQFNVLNYGVIGYGLEQMLASLQSNLSEVKADDFVIFAPSTYDFYRNTIDNSLYCKMMLLNKEGQSASGLKHVPAFRNGELHVIDLREECDLLETLLLNSYAMPMGAIYRRYRNDEHKQASLDYADQLLAQAADLAHQRNAHFLLVILVTPDECKKGALNSDLHRLSIPFESLMSFCPRDPNSLESLEFPNDPHWSRDGNRWAAFALEEILKAQLPPFR